MAVKLWSENFTSGAGLECMNERFFSALWIYLMPFHFSSTPWVLALSGDPSTHFKPSPLCSPTKKSMKNVEKCSCSLCC